MNMMNSDLGRLVLMLSISLAAPLACTDGGDPGEPTSESGSEPTGDGDGPSCASIEDDYEALVGMTACAGDDECKIVDGECSAGLGGCYHVVSTSVDEAALSDLGDAYSDLGCTSGACDCAAPPSGAACVDGSCVPLE